MTTRDVGPGTLIPMSGGGMRNSRGLFRRAGAVGGVPSPHRNALGLIGACVSAGVILAVTLGPVVWHDSAYTQNLSSAFQSPSWSHPFGLDPFGRDILKRILVGGRESMIIGVGGALTSLAIGVLAGVYAAMTSGIVRMIVLRATDMLLALPQVVLAVVLVSALGFGVFPLFVALTLSTVPIFVRLAYSAGRGVVSQDYVASAHCSGRGNMSTAVLHVLPNIAAPVLAAASFNSGSLILVEAGLSFFGLGVQPPSPSWGLMIAESQQYLVGHPTLIVFPGVAIVLASLGFNLLGDGISQWLDPRTRVSR